MYNYMEGLSLYHMCLRRARHGSGFQCDFQGDVFDDDKVIAWIAP